MMGFRSNGYFVIGAPYQSGGHGYGFASSMDHQRLDSVSCQYMTVCINIRGTGVVLQVDWASATLVGKGLISWVDHVELNYDMILVISIYDCIMRFSAISVMLFQFTLASLVAIMDFKLKFFLLRESFLLQTLFGEDEIPMVLFVQNKTGRQTMKLTIGLLISLGSYKSGHKF